jgi:hypothetical protein
LVRFSKICVTGSLEILKCTFLAWIRIELECWIRFHNHENSKYQKSILSDNICLFLDSILAECGIVDVLGIVWVLEVGDLQVGLIAAVGGIHTAHSATQVSPLTIGTVSVPVEIKTENKCGHQCFGYALIACGSGSSILDEIK